MNFKLHHIGCAVKSTQKAIDYYTNVLGYEVFEDTFEYPQQNIKVTFLAMKDSALLELVEGINEKSPVKKIIDSLGGGTYHMCYEVEDINEAVKYLCKYDFVQNRKTQMENDKYKAVYMITPENYLLELIEMK